MKPNKEAGHHISIDTPLHQKGTGVFRAICHPLRLRMIELINRHQTLTVTEVYKNLKIEQSVASSHLKLLRDAGIVRTRRDGKNIFYRVDRERIKKIHSISGELLNFKIEHISTEKAPRTKVITNYFLFSHQEKQIIRMICDQYTNEEIATALTLSKRTVEGYRDRIIEKMKVKNTAGLVVYAIKARLYEI